MLRYRDTVKKSVDGLEKSISRVYTIITRYKKQRRRVWGNNLNIRI